MSKTNLSTMFNHVGYRFTSVSVFFCHEEEEEEEGEEGRRPAHKRGTFGCGNNVVQGNPKFVQGLFKVCSSVVQGCCFLMDASGDSLVQGLFKVCSRFLQGLFKVVFLMVFSPVRETP